MDTTREALCAEIDTLLESVQKAKEQISRVIIGMDDVIDLLFVGLLARGHCMAESSPGQAKTKLMRAMAHVLGLSYGRVQGNPGLTPDDIIGQYLPGISDGIHTFRGGLQFFPGSIFNEVLFWDEANRTSPKTQASFLQGMEEYRVTTAYGDQEDLPNPFMVLATQNPQEIMQGTYPMTEANLDRFLISIPLTYPNEEEEVKIVLQDDDEPFVEDLIPCLNAQQILRMRHLVTEVFPSSIYMRMAQYAVRLCRSTRPQLAGSRKIKSIEGMLCRMDEIVHAGVSTRAEKLLARAARAHAFLTRCEQCTPRNVQAVVPYVLRHRIVLQPRASHLRFTVEHVIDELLAQVSEI